MSSKASVLQKAVPILIVLLFGIAAGQQSLQPTPQPLPFPSCNACNVFGDSQSCNGEFGCLWNAQLNICGNGCLYPNQNRCESCGDTCRWISGSFSACIVKWDFIFDVCFVIDDSQSITFSEWDAIREFFIIGVIEALTPLSCVLGSPSAAEKCPSVGIVQFNFDSLVVIPENLAAKSPQYATTVGGQTRGQFSICFANDTILEPLNPNWRNTVRAMQLGIVRSGLNGGGTFTLRGVTRCVDLLSNTAATRERSLSLLVTQTDGNPNGPLECFGSACSVCGVDKYHEAVFALNDFSQYPECGPNFIDPYQRSLINRMNRAKIQQYQIRNILVLYKFGVDAVVQITNVDCLVTLVPPLQTIFFIPEARLNRFQTDPAARFDLEADVVNISNILCQFQTNPPTMSPTLSPTESPTNSPTTTTTSTTTTATTTTVEPTPMPTPRPTTCQGPPPSIPREDCDRSGCMGDDAPVSVNPMPSVTTDNDAGTTTLCYEYSLQSPGGACDPEGKPIRGVSFAMDECCPDGAMDFLSSVSMGGSSFERSECPMVDAADAGNGGCTRSTRACSSLGNENEDCTVVSVNDVDEDGNGQYCLTVNGVGFDDNEDNVLDESDLAKLCFERGDSPAASNVCGCVDVYFIPSGDICDRTPRPTPAPTPLPTPRPTPVPTPGGCDASLPDVPSDSACELNCGEISNTEWSATLEEYTPGDDYTYFKYCVAIDDSEEPDCQVAGDSGSNGGNGRGKSSKSSSQGNGGNGVRKGSKGNNGSKKLGQGFKQRNKGKNSGGGSGNKGNSKQNKGNKGNQGGKGSKGKLGKKNSGNNGGNGRWRSGGGKRRLAQAKWNNNRNSRKAGKKNGRFFSSSSARSPFSNPAVLTLRLDQCCPLCLTKEYHVVASSGNLRIANPNEGSAYMRLGGKDDKYPSGNQCFDFKLKGYIGLEQGKYCVRGGSKCGCDVIDVPSSCALKDVADPSCRSSSSSSSSSRGGRSRSRRRGGWSDDR